MYILNICCSALSVGEEGGGVNAMLAKHITQKSINDPLSEYKKIPLGHNSTNDAVNSKINFKVEINLLCTLDIHHIT